jgi:putative sterol carrier protein
MIKFLTKEWFEEVKRRTNESSEMEKEGKELTAKILYHITDCPDSVYGGGPEIYFCYVFKEGKLIEVLFDDVKDADFKTTTTYDYLSKIVKGEITPLEAFTSGNIEFEGDAVRAMKLLKATNIFASIVSSIETEF